MSATSNPSAARLAVLGYLLVVIMPPGLILARAFARPETFLMAASFCLSSRGSTLLTHSLLLGLAVAAAGGACGFGVALRLLSRRSAATAALLLLAVFVPPHVHALAWSVVVSRWNDLGLVLLPVTGFWPSFWVQFVASLPMATILSASGILALAPALVEAGLVTAPVERVLARVLLPLSAPLLAAVIATLLVLSLLDSGVPLLFQYGVFATAVTTDYAATGDPVRAAGLALPLVVIALLAIGLAVGAGRRLAKNSTSAYRGEAARIELRGAWKTGAALCLLIAAAQVLVPFLGLLAAAESAATVISSIHDSRAEISLSFSVAAAAAAIAVLLGAGLAEFMARRSLSGALTWSLVLVPLAVPAPLVGVGLIEAWNRPGPLGLHGSVAMPILAGVARFAPWAALVMAALKSRLDPNLVEAARLLRPDSLATFLRVRLPLMAPAAGAGFCLVFALTLGELGATMLVIPPGLSTITMKTFNYMHYGASARVASLGLASMLFAILAHAAAWRLLAGRNQ